MVANRLRRELIAKNVLQDQQFGFRPQHNTAQAVMSIMKGVKKGFKQGQSTSMVLLDLEKALDTVSHECLLYKMIKLGINPSLIKLIRSYLSMRTFQVSMRNVLSKPKSAPAGVPQGSVIGPLLFLIYVHDMPEHRRTNLTIFADDTSIRCTSKNHRLAAKWIQEHLDDLTQYFEKWKIRLNPQKCEAIHFTKTSNGYDLRLEINGHPIPTVKKVKYLGVMLQTNMKHSEHINLVKKKAENIKSKLWPLIGNRSALQWSNKVLLVKTLIRPILTYNLHLISDMSESSWKKMEAVVNKALRTALNLRPDRQNSFRQLPTGDLHQIAKVESLRDTADKMKAKFLHSCLQHENFMVRKLRY